MQGKQASLFNDYASVFCLLFVLSVFLSSCASSDVDIDSGQQVNKTEDNNPSKGATDLVVVDASNEASIETAYTSNDKSIDVNIVIVNEARSIDFVKSAITAASTLFEKCQITLKATLRTVVLAPDTSINRETQEHLVANYAVLKPALFVVPSTAARDVAFSYLPSLQLDIAGTSWMSNRVSDRCFVWIMVHELGHVMFDHAKHSAGFNNIMSVSCKLKNWGSRKIAPDWTDEQCVELRRSNSVKPI